MECTECQTEMKLIDSFGGTQSNGCDADVDVYECPACGHKDTD